MKNKNKGITLIALVVTIVVLLILAGISISMLTGDNGVITQSKNAKEATEQAKVEELVSVAIGSVISKNNGSTAGITPKMVADQINEDEKRTDVYAENETTFPTNIIFPKENRKAEVKLNVKSADTEDSIYSEDVNEIDIAPVNLFDYEIINDGETGALTLDNLPTKTVKITRIKPEYCNHFGYNPYTKENDYTDTNYEIIYKGNKISKTLIIPYQVDGKYVPNGIAGEYYKVTEVSLSIEEKDPTAEEKSDFASIPDIEELIYPDTVEKILSKGKCSKNNKLKSIVISNNIKEIPNEMFSYGMYEDGLHTITTLTKVIIGNNITDLEWIDFTRCSNLTKVVIGDGITAIKDYTFSGCNNLKDITIGKGVTNIKAFAFNGCGNLVKIKVSEENSKYDSRNNCNAIVEKDTNTIIRGCNTTVIPESVTSIGTFAFAWCNGLTGIIIPKSVTSIGQYAFVGCSNLTNITIPDSITSIAPYAFGGCSNLTNITIPDSITSIAPYAFVECNSLTKINYTGTEEKWNNITIEDGNEVLKNATVNYNYNK